MTDLPKISIITIVFNGAAVLEKTIQSIANQTYPHIEYIIIDGGSVDGTLDIIHQHQDVISQWVSEADEGLYDAMNKGMRLATGDYYWFINAGDEIYIPTTLDRIFNANNAPFYDVYYGDTIMIDAEGYEIGNRRLKPPQSLSWKDFKNGMLVSHQSVIVSKRVAPSYNTDYAFSADFEWCLLALKKADRVVNTHQVLSRFLDGGITKQNLLAGLKERFQIMSQHFGFAPTLGQHVIIGSRFLYYLVRYKRF